MDILESPGGGPKVYKWVTDALPVLIGQLDPYVVFGTKFGAAQDFQRGKKCSIGVKQTPLDRCWLPLYPPKPLGTPPKPLQWSSLQLM